MPRFHPFSSLLIAARVIPDRSDTSVRLNPCRSRICLRRTVSSRSSMNCPWEPVHRVPPGRSARPGRGARFSIGRESPPRRPAAPGSVRAWNLSDSSLPPLRRGDFVGCDGIDGPGVVQHLFPDDRDELAGRSRAENLRPARSTAPTRSAPGVAENLFGLLHRDAVFGQVLNVSLWVVFQVPDDGGVDHRYLPWGCPCCILV